MIAVVRDLQVVNTETVAVYGLEPQVRLQLKMLAAAQGRTMAEMVTKLIEQAYNNEQFALDGKKRRKVKRLIKKALGRHILHLKYRTNVS